MMSLWRRASLALLLGYCVLLSSCAFPGMVETDAQLPLVKTANQQPSLPPASLPKDEGAHNYLTEWWYYTGHLDGEQGKHYGFELVIFQSLRSDLPPLYTAHFAISDLSRQRFAYDQRSIMIPVEKSKTQGIHASVGDWTIQGFNGHDHLQAAMKEYAIKLDLSSMKPPALHNGNGLITYGLGGFSYYYSRTRMSVRGTLTDHGQPLQVSGQAWMDHQWGNFLTLGSSGWDWYSLQLSNGADIMIYFIRDDKGNVISTYAGYIGNQGQDRVIPAQAVKNTVLEHWTSPTTGITYPSGWRVMIQDLGLDLTIRPLLKDQELVTTRTTGKTYWEGAVEIEGRQDKQNLTGQGYIELTGYLK
ncbi:lipocalin-like domain-containing protein [Ktedonospora formicarum]|nr:lipocalin-like domain-containing protein [Ktedonospora formicarum]